MVTVTHTDPSIISVQYSYSSHGNGHKYFVVWVTQLLDMNSVGTHYIL